MVVSGGPKVGCTCIHTRVGAIISVGRTDENSIISASRTDTNSIISAPVEMITRWRLFSRFVTPVLSCATS